MKSILMIAPKEYPCSHAMLETVYSKILPERGWRVHWLMFSRSVRQPQLTTWNGSRVTLLPVRASDGVRSFVARQFAWRQLRHEAIRLASENPFSIYQVRNEVLAAEIAQQLSRTTRGSFVYQISYYDPESLIAAANRGARAFPMIQRYRARLQMSNRNRLARDADLVLAISDTMRDDIVQRWNVPPQRVLSFPLGTDCPPAVSLSEVDALRRELGLRADAVVLYVGAIAPQRQLDFLIDVAGRVQRPGVSFLFVGPSKEGERERLQALARAQGLQNIIFVDAVPREEVPRYFALASLSVSPIPTNDQYLISSPTKAIESLAAGCPVVGTPIPDQATVIERSAGGMVVSFDRQLFANAIETLLQDPDKLRQMGERGREYVREHRSYEQLATTVEDAYQRLMSPGQRASDSGGRFVSAERA